MKKTLFLTSLAFSSLLMANSQPSDMSVSYNRSVNATGDILAGANPKVDADFGLSSINVTSYLSNNFRASISIGNSQDVEFTDPDDNFSTDQMNFNLEMVHNGERVNTITGEGSELRYGYQRWSNKDEDGVKDNENNLILAHSTGLGDGMTLHSSIAVDVSDGFKDRDITLDFEKYLTSGVSATIGYRMMDHITEDDTEITVRGLMIGLKYNF